MTSCPSAERPARALPPVSPGIGRRRATVDAVALRVLRDGVCARAFEPLLPVFAMEASSPPIVAWAVVHRYDAARCGRGAVAKVCVLDTARRWRQLPFGDEGA